MRIVLDTNIIVSALIAPRSLLGSVLRHWQEGRFDLISCEEQISELRRVTRYSKIRLLVPAHVAGRAVNDLKESATWLRQLPAVELCRDPNDNYLLSMAQASNADFLVTGDKADLLIMGRHRTTRIVSARAIADMLGF